MSTRGLWGIRKDGQDLLTYNHANSYPEWLGERICSFVKTMSDNDMEKLVLMLKPVSENTPAISEDIQLCKQLKITDFTIGDRKETDYYCLLRKTQGNIEFYEELVKNPPSFMQGKMLPFIQNSTFILDSLYCEYAYILNLDKRCLEFWVGFQTKPDPKNRYGTEELNGYFPCKQLEAFSFEKIRGNSEESLVTEMIQYKAISEIENSSQLSNKDLWRYVEKYIPKEEIDHHGNGNGLDDLYLKKTKLSKALVERYQYKENVSTFRSQIDGNIWYELPFLYPIKETN